jgi:hypothetical protein
VTSVSHVKNISVNRGRTVTALVPGVPCPQCQRPDERPELPHDWCSLIATSDSTAAVRSSTFRAGLPMLTNWPIGTQVHIDAAGSTRRLRLIDVQHDRPAVEFVFEVWTLMKRW